MFFYGKKIILVVHDNLFDRYTTLSKYKFKNKKRKTSLLRLAVILPHIIYSNITFSFFKKCLKHFVIYRYIPPDSLNKKINKGVTVEFIIYYAELLCTLNE